MCRMGCVTCSGLEYPVKDYICTICQWSWGVVLMCRDKPLKRTANPQHTLYRNTHTCSHRAIGSNPAAPVYEAVTPLCSLRLLS